MTEISEKEVAGRLPLSFTDTPDYAEVRDKDGKLVALTTEPRFFEALAEAAAHARAEAVGVKVKDLEWKTLREGESYAAVGAGITYRLVKAAFSANAWFWYRLGDHQSECENFEAARAAAQADYEQRILSALAHPAVPEGMVLVPREPTKKMIEAMVFAFDADGSNRAAWTHPTGQMKLKTARGKALTRYRAMIAAAEKEGE